VGSCLLTKGGIGKFVGKLEKFAGLFSAIVHGTDRSPEPPAPRVAHFA
jgi:hypothetical protein